MGVDNVIVGHFNEGGTAAQLLIGAAHEAEEEEFESLIIVACTKDGTIRTGHVGESHLELVGMLHFAAYALSDRMRED